MTAKNLTPAFVLLICLLTTSCSKVIFEVYPIPEYTGTMTWKQVENDVSWTGRWDHASVVYQNKIWVLGGYNSGNRDQDSYFEDVWCSDDGKRWDLVNSSAPWLGRRGHAAVVFDDGSGEAMFLIGGFTVEEGSGSRQYCNDVWKSVDGNTWLEIKPNTQPGFGSENDWVPRFNHRCEVVNIEGKQVILLIAGATMEQNAPANQGMNYLNDVWSTENGITWKRLDSNDFGIRSEHSTSVDPVTKRIYLQGGTYGIHDAGETRTDKPVYQWQELWSSADGLKWTAENDELGFPQACLYRAQHQIIHYGDYLWGFPGKNSNSASFSDNSDTYAIWKIDQYGTWSVDSDGPPFKPRYGYSLVVFMDQIWILGGYTTHRGPGNEIWAGQL